MFKLIFAFLSLLTLTVPAYAVGSLIAVEVLGMTAGLWATTAVAFATKPLLLAFSISIL